MTEKRVFNIVRFRGDPKKAVLESGHEVTKQEFVYFKEENGAWISLKCADYHNEHFVYIDPVFNEEGKHATGHWFAMCTCGSHAVIIGPRESRLTHDVDAIENMLVCNYYTTTLLQFGVGVHAGQDRREWR